MPFFPEKPVVIPPPTAQTINGALSNGFAPPAPCFSEFTYISFSGTSFLAQNAFPPIVSSACFPGHFFDAGKWPVYGPIYSPGVCPNGYSTASTGSNTGGMTTAVCCQSSFTYTGVGFEVYSACMSVDNSGQPKTVASLIHKSKTTTTTTISPIPGDPLTIWAAPITIGYHQPPPPTLTSTLDTQTPPKSSSAVDPSTASPINSLPTPIISSTAPPSSGSFVTSKTPESTPLPATVLSTSNITITNSTTISPFTTTTQPKEITTTQSSPTTLSQTHHHTKHLSPGAKAGISISVLLAALLIALTALLLYRRRKLLKTSNEKFIMQTPSPSENSLDLPTQQNGLLSPPRNGSINTTTTTTTTTTTLQPRKSWKSFPARFPSWRARVGSIRSGGRRSEMQEVPVSPVSPISSSSSGSRGSEGGGKRPVSPVSSLG